MATTGENPEIEEERNESQEMYEAAESYWKSIDPSVDGMLGGFGNLSQTDVTDSRAFLKVLRSKCRVPKHRALDCGAGIGRITKNLLLPCFHTVDMVDVTNEFLESSTSYLGQLNERVGEKFCCGLQDFIPNEKYYDTIWVQWVSGHLTDDHFVRFLKRCKAGLTEKGMIVLKENMSSSELSDFDEDDNSYTRSRTLLLQLFNNTNMRVIKEKKQQSWPKGMYEVRMFALQ